jgi:hypothetical protein
VSFRVSFWITDLSKRGFLPKLLNKGISFAHDAAPLFLKLTTGVMT